MPKINLITRVQKKQNQKRRASKNSVWIIATEQNNKEYYVSKIDEKVAAIIWSNKTDKAMKFHTEKGCQHFAQTYLKSRTDVHLRLLEGGVIC